MVTPEVPSHQPRTSVAGHQSLMPVRYGLAVQLLSVAAFTLAFFGWLNETWLFWFDNPVWLNRYTEYVIILVFGLWRIIAEQNSYTRKRLIILVAMVTVFWWLVPWLYPVYEPYVGFLWAQPVFPSLHVPGTLTFFIVLLLVFLFGRRVICGFNCPCVGIRETVGFPFRDRTLRSARSWKWRHSKWLFFVYYVGVLVVTQFPPNSWTVSFVGGFYLIIGLSYFGTFFIAPLVGNRFYCRYLCPFGATFGLLNHAGFYGIDMEQDKCNDCRRCEQVCDMGIPVWRQGSQSGRVTALEDCMGCARCVLSCPTDALAIRDVRNLFRPALKQNASHLLGRQVPVSETPRQEPDSRPPAERIQDWQEITQVPALATIQAQAARCLDCGVPGCRHGCPLSNRIPEWLEAVVAGDIEQAASLCHATSNLPEICGRLCPQHRLCEGACTRAREPAGAVTIGAVERFVNDQALRRGWTPPGPRQRLDRRVAVIGAGPAGLACAEQLNRAGCRVTVYDRLPVIGGLLASGVPSFKLDKTHLQRRHRLLAGQGIGFELGTEVDEAMMQALLQGHDAVFLGFGAQRPRHLSLPGVDRSGVVTALDYLAGINLGADLTSLASRQVLVIGGGDSAMDCARAAIRQGAARVTVVCRGNRENMRASPKEQQDARAEGVEFCFELVPVEVLGDARVQAVAFENPAGQRKEISCDALICALGQQPAAPGWLQRFGVETDDQGRIVIDARGRTTNPKIFAGGDNTHGPDLVVTAIAAGRKAADGMLHHFHPLRRISGRVSDSFTGRLPAPATVAATLRQEEVSR